MASAFDDPATMLEIVANRTLVTAIGKALVNKELISSSDIASKLSEIIQALEESGGDRLLIAELKHILGVVVTW